MSAALGVAQLERLDDLLSRRQEIAARYDDLLCKVPGVGIKHIAASTTRMSWFVYIVQLDPAIDRNRVIADLDKRKIASRAYFEPIHLQPAYQRRFGFRKGDFPITERIAASTLALPFHANLLPSDVGAVVDALQSAIHLAAA
jgi:perosamine synthetase